MKLHDGTIVPSIDPRAIRRFDQFPKYYVGVQPKETKFAVARHEKA